LEYRTKDMSFKKTVKKFDVFSSLLCALYAAHVMVYHHSWVKNGLKIREKLGIKGAMTLCHAVKGNCLVFFGPSSSFILALASGSEQDEKPLVLFCSVLSLTRMMMDAFPLFSARKDEQGLVDGNVNNLVGRFYSHFSKSQEPRAIYKMFRKPYKSLTSWFWVRHFPCLKLKCDQTRD